MSVIEIRDRSAAAVSAHSRTACRGILVREGALLLSYERNTDQYFIPGGGMEEGESLSECCVREMAEETGILVRTGPLFLTFREFYGDWCWISHYFVCEQVGECQRKLTESEFENGLEPVWVPIDEALRIFGSYGEHNGWKRGAYFRDFSALQKFISPHPASASPSDGL